MFASISRPMPSRKLDQPDALDHLAGALVLQRVFGKEVDGFLAQLDQGLIVLFVFRA